MASMLVKNEAKDDEFPTELARLRKAYSLLEASFVSSQAMVTEGWLRYVEHILVTEHGVDLDAPEASS